MRHVAAGFGGSCICISVEFQPLWSVEVVEALTSQAKFTWAVV